MIKKCFVSMRLLMVIMVFAAGCAVNRVAKDYGNSAMLVKRNQILTPDAAKNLEPVCGFDSHAAEATIVRYQMSFANQNAANFPTTGVVGATSSAPSSPVAGGK